MGKYFVNANTLEQLRKQYKELLKKFHPDNGGSEDVMKAVNVEYDKLFKVLKDRHERKISLTLRARWIAGNFCIPGMKPTWS